MTLFGNVRASSNLYRILGSMVILYIGSVGLMEFRKCRREISGISGTVSFFHDAAAIVIVICTSGFILVIIVALISPILFLCWFKHIFSC